MRERPVCPIPVPILPAVDLHSADADHGLDQARTGLGPTGEGFRQPIDAGAMGDKGIGRDAAIAERAGHMFEIRLQRVAVPMSIISRL